MINNIIMEKITFSAEEDIVEEIHSNLDYGDNRSAWVRDAIRLKLAVIEELDEAEKMTDEERREFVVQAVQDALDED